MKNRFLLFVITCVLCSFVSAQTTSTNRTIATQQIRDLKNGALILTQATHRPRA